VFERFVTLLYIVSYFARMSAVSLIKLNWLSKVHRAFEGRTPLEMLRLGYLSDVLVEARAVGVGW
jgi:hypothetical protein